MPVAPTTETHPATGAARRRVWAAPVVRSHGSVVLTADRLVLTASTDPGENTVLPVTVVELAAVRRAALDLVRNSLTVEFAGPAGPGAATVVFAAPDAADACFTKLWRLLGPAVKLSPPPRDPWTLAAAPLAALAVVLLLTAALAVAVATFNEYAEDRSAGVVSVPAAGDFGRPEDGSVSALERWVGWMDWRVVCGLGGAAAAATQVWLYRRVTAPPARLELARG